MSKSAKRGDQKTQEHIRKRAVKAVVEKGHKPALVAEAFGVNSILAYSLSSILTVIFYSSELWCIAFNQEFIKFWGDIGLPLKLGSLIYAIMYVVVLWVPCNYLYKKKIFIKL